MISDVSEFLTAGKASRQSLPSLGTMSWWSITNGEMTLDELRERFLQHDPGAPTRSSTLAQKAEQFQKCSVKAEMYESLLEMEAVDLHDQIAGLHPQVELAMANGMGTLALSA